MRQEPYGAGGRTLAALGIRRRVVEIAIDVENMNVFRRHTLQSLSRADHNTAVAPDQQRDVRGLLQVGLNTLANAVPMRSGGPADS